MKSIMSSAELFPNLNELNFDGNISAGESEGIPAIIAAPNSTKATALANFNNCQPISHVLKFETRGGIGSQFAIELLDDQSKMIIRKDIYLSFDQEFHSEIHSFTPHTHFCKLRITIMTANSTIEIRRISLMTAIYVMDSSTTVLADVSGNEIGTMILVSELFPSTHRVFDPVAGIFQDIVHNFVFTIVPGDEGSAALEWLKPGSGFARLGNAENSETSYIIVAQNHGCIRVCHLSNPQIPCDETIPIFGNLEWDAYLDSRPAPPENTP
jgi:hypothetical protein